VDSRPPSALALKASFGMLWSFHAQQAAEKYLKALPTRRQIEFGRNGQRWYHGSSGTGNVSSPISQGRETRAPMNTEARHRVHV